LLWEEKEKPLQKTTKRTKGHTVGCEVVAGGGGGL
jgi:hypothetical protein